MADNSSAHTNGSSESAKLEQPAFVPPVTGTNVISVTEDKSVQEQSLAIHAAEVKTALTKGIVDSLSQLQGLNLLSKSTLVVPAKFLVLFGCATFVALMALRSLPFKTLEFRDSLGFLITAVLLIGAGVTLFYLQYRAEKATIGVADAAARGLVATLEDTKQS